MTLFVHGENALTDAGKDYRQLFFWWCKKVFAVKIKLKKALKNMPTFEAPKRRANIVEGYVDVVGIEIF